MNEKESERSFGELPTLGHEETRKAEPRSAAEGPSWSALGLSEAETLKAPAEGIRDDGRTDAARRWKPGEVILERYVVEGELGQGGMGVVYACLDKVGGVRVAVKCLPPELSHNSVEMEDVRENFRLVFGLNHQNIVSLKMLEKDGRGEYFLVMEVGEGESLRKWERNKWKAGGVSPAEAAGVLKQVASALDYAHGEKVVHRDVKPGNVVIDGRGRVKVLDFGLAAQIRTSLSRASHTYRGTSGTGPYMAPEQWRGRRQDGKTDQYALGVMAYEMLAGYLPFENEEVTVLREAVLREEPEDIPGVPAGTMAAIRRAMAKTAAERFSTCGEFAEALEAGAGGGGTGKGSASLPSVPEQGTADGAVGRRRAHSEASHRQEPVGGVGQSREVPGIRAKEAMGGDESRGPAGGAWLFVVVLLLACVFGAVCVWWPSRPKRMQEQSVFAILPRETVPDSREASNQAPQVLVADETGELVPSEALEAARPEGSPHQGSRAGERTTVRVGGQEVALRWCPADTFTMGSPEGEEGRWRYEGETQHRVTLTRGFWMGETEVTQGLWREVTGENPSRFKNGDNYPVECVSWEDCQKFVQALNARHPQEGMRWALPTEAQWEYACRAGTGTAYFWGNALNGDKANCNGNSPCGTTVKGPYKEKTTPVGSYDPNAWGLYDMHGNVWEWCADWYGPYPSGLVTDPTGPREGSSRVYRGGAWNSSARVCRSANRTHHYDPGGYRRGYLGFRVALIPVQ